MPKPARITKDMIIEAAVDLIRESGYESINARTLAAKLHCSTQPVMYHFETIESLKRAAYEYTDHMHTQYLMSIEEDQDPVLSIGLNYMFSSPSYSVFFSSRDTLRKAVFWK